MIYTIFIIILWIIKVTKIAQVETHYARMRLIERNAK